MTDWKTLSHTFGKPENNSRSQRFDCALDDLTKFFARKCANEIFAMELEKQKQDLLKSEKDFP